MARTSPALKKYEEATAAYLHNLEHTGAAPLTVRNYASRLANFLAFWSGKMRSPTAPFLTPAIQTYRPGGMISWTRGASSPRSGST